MLQELSNIIEESFTNEEFQKQIYQYIKEIPNVERSEFSNLVQTIIQL